MKNVLWCMGHDLIIEDIIRAEGIYVIDSHGNKYADFESGIWVASLGHNHPNLQQALIDQTGQVIHNGYCYVSPVVDEAAGEILSVNNIDNGKCVFLCSGSEANEFGVKAIQKIAGRPFLLTLKDSYLSAYGSAGNKPQDEWAIFDWSTCADCIRSTDCTPDCDAFADIPFDKIGGFVFEPGSASGMVRFPPRKLIETIAGIITGNGGVIMVNEVTTGIGRTGEWFGYIHYGLTPDIVAMGKGLGAGYPVSAVVLTDNIAARLETAGFHYGQSHQNDPLGAAAALAVIRTIRDDRLIENCRKMGSVLREGLQTIRDKYGVIKAIRGRGLMTAVDFIDRNNTDIAGTVHREMIRNGYIIARRPGLNTLRIDPPLITTPDQIAGFLHAFETVLSGLDEADE